MREVAQEERAGLGLDEDQPLDPYALATEHGIPVYTLTDLLLYGLTGGTHDHFHLAGSGLWSAALIPRGTARVIVENDAHTSARRRSNIAHELGHHLLEHGFDEIILGDDHKRQFNVEQERQAKFISGELLIPEQAARRAAYKGWDNEQVAEHFLVSTQLAGMRMAGARVIAKRAIQKFGR